MNIALKVSHMLSTRFIKSESQEMSDISLGKRIAEWMDSSLDGLLFTQSTCTVSIETRRAIWLSIGRKGGREGRGGGMRDEWMISARAMIDSGEEVGRCLYVLTESRDAIKIQVRKRKRDFILHQSHLNSGSITTSS